MVSIRWYLGFLKGQLGGAGIDFWGPGSLSIGYLGPLSVMKLAATCLVDRSASSGTHTSSTRGLRLRAPPKKPRNTYGSYMLRLRPKTRGIPETMLCRNLMLAWRLGRYENFNYPRRHRRCHQVGPIPGVRPRYIVAITGSLPPALPRRGAGRFVCCCVAKSRCRCC